MTIMRMRLVDLLNKREICHPSRIIDMSVTGSVQRVTVAGTPWWRPGASPFNEELLYLIFIGGSTRVVSMPEYSYEEEALEDFTVHPRVELPWSWPRAHSIYCNSPLGDPFRLYALVEDYLMKVGAVETARDFLNIPNDLLSCFQNICSSNSYLVASGPDVIHDLVCGELLRQGVAHNVLSGPVSPPSGLYVRLLDHCFYCDDAFAEFERDDST